MSNKNAVQLYVVVAVLLLAVVACGFFAWGKSQNEVPATAPTKAALVAPTAGIVPSSASPADTCGSIGGLKTTELRQDGTVTIGDLQVSTVLTGETVAITVTDAGGAQQTLESIDAIVVSDKAGKLNAAKLVRSEQHSYKDVLLVADWGSVGQVFVCHK